MLLECRRKYVRMAVAMLSLIISMGFIVAVEALPRQHKEDQHIMNHVCLLQIICSVLLFVGSLKCNRWCFLPWLSIAVVFVYALIYKSLDIWLHILSNLRRSLLIISLLYIISGFWCYFIHAVIVDFQEMQRQNRKLAHKYVII